MRLGERSLIPEETLGSSPGEPEMDPVMFNGEELQTTEGENPKKPRESLKR